MSLLENQDFCRAVEAIQQRFSTPGVSVSIVDLKSGSKQTKGFVLPDTGIVISDDTVLPIASNTKLFTVFALAILVEEKKIPSFDVKLRDIIPDLDLVDSYATETLTLAGILSHQAGLAGHWLLHSNQTIKLEDAVRVYNGMRPSLPVRTEAQYDNAGFYVAGLIIERLTGQDFTDFVYERILRPLGMNATKFSFDVNRSKVIKPFEVNRATGESQEIHVDYTLVPKRGWGQAGGGGGINTTGPDMMTWCTHLLKLSSNTLDADDPKIISHKTFMDIIRGRALATQQVGAIPSKVGQSLWPECSPGLYALGQLTFHYRGIPVSSHNGTASGCSSTFIWLPGGSFGIHVAGNCNSSSFNVAPAIGLTALDFILGYPVLDWAERMLALPYTSQKYPDIPVRELVSDNLQAKLSGTYKDSIYNELHIVDINFEGGPVPDYAYAFIRAAIGARTFGDVPARRPDLYGVFENKLLYPYYIALYQTTGTTYFGQLHYLYEVNGEHVNIPESTSMFTGEGALRMEFGEDRLEYYLEWDSHLVRTGKGQATFHRVQ